MNGQLWNVERFIVTTEEARALSQEVGVVIHWAPDGDLGPNSYAMVTRYERKGK